MSRTLALPLAAAAMWILAACTDGPPPPAAGAITTGVRFESLETFPGGAATPPGEVTGLFTLPSGPGPFPTVILLHGCSGLFEAHAEWAEALAAWGWASLRVDSFTPRGIDEICTDILRPVPRAADVNGAIAFLQARPEIDAGRLAVMGWSHGASVALQVAAEPGSLRPDLKPALRATVAVYPYCSRNSQPFREPLLVLIGEEDDWTPADICRSMVDDLPSGSAPVELVVYPGVTHSYDCRSCDGTYWGHHLVFDSEAFADSHARVRAFLEAAFAAP